MIGFVVAFLPLILGMAMVHFFARARRPGDTRLLERHAASQHTPSRTTQQPSPAIDPAVVDSDAEQIPAWTALDDIQLDRLLKQG